MTTKTIRADDGAVLTETIEDRKAFVNFERSIQVKPYETAKASAHVQVDLGSDGDALTLPAALKEAYAVAKTAVFEQLGLSYEVDEVNLVVIEKLERELGAEVVEGAKPRKATARKAAPSRKSSGKPSDEQIEEAWADLENNPDGWFDNRSDKRNPKAPDFKAKNNNKAVEGGFALWLDSAPDWFDEPPI